MPIASLFVKSVPSSFFPDKPASIEDMADENAVDEITVRKTLGANVARIRGLRGMTVRDLSKRLETLGFRLSPSGVSEVENAGRKVSVEELLVIAIALNTSIIDLLTPEKGEPLPVADTVPPLNPSQLELWLQGRHPWPNSTQAQAISDFMGTASQRRQDERRRSRRPEIEAITRLRAHVELVIRAQEDPQGFGAETPFTAGAEVGILRQLLKDVDDYINLLASTIERDGYGG